MLQIQRKTFFAEYKKAFGAIKCTETVSGLEFLLGRFETDKWQDIRLISYLMATVKHETADTFQPIKEYRNRVGSKGRANQDRYWNTGYYGRGFVQITWEENYKKLGKLVGADLVKNPDLALVPDIAFEILVIGTLRGLFTGKKLSDFINDKKTDFKNARKVVNGLDKADLIAGYAVKFQSILKSSLETSAAHLHNLQTNAPVGDALDETPAADIHAEPTDEPPISQTAENIINTGTQTGEEILIDAAANAPDVQITAPEPLNFLTKLWQTIAGIFAGTIVLPSFLQNGLDFNAAISLIVNLISQNFKYILFAALGGLTVWFLTKKVNSYKITKLKIETNADMTKRNIVFRGNI